MKKSISLLLFFSLFLSLGACTSNSGSPAPTTAIYGPKFDGDGVMGNKEKNYIAYVQGATKAAIVSLQKEETKAFRFTKELSKPIEGLGEVALNLLQRSSDGKSLKVQGESQTFHLVQATLKEVDADLPAVLATLPSDPGFVPYTGPSGTNDETFGGGTGHIVESFSVGVSLFTDVLVMSDGTILVGGTASNHLLLKRFLPDGSPDPTFGVNGVVQDPGCLRTAMPLELLNYRGGTRGLAVQSTGKIIAGCLGNEGGAPRGNIARYHSDGTIDSTFGLFGYGYYDGSDSGTTRGIKVDLADGIHFLSRDTNLNLQHVTHLNAYGVKNTSFSIAMSSTPGFALDSLLRVYVAAGMGLAGGRFDEASYSPNPLYNNPPGIPADLQSRDIIFQPDHKAIILASSSTPNSWHLARYNDNGTQDSAFGGPSGAMISSGTYQLDGNAMALQSDGKIIVAGSALLPPSIVSDGALGRLLPNGTIDNDFGSFGIRTIAGTTTIQRFYDVAIQPDGRIIAVGITSGNFTAISRINP